jgi:hypothetical protein
MRINRKLTDFNRKLLKIFCIGIENTDFQVTYSVSYRIGIIMKIFVSSELTVFLTLLDRSGNRDNMVGHHCCFLKFLNTTSAWHI